MKRAVVYYATSIGLLIVLSGCGPMVDWGKSNFYQGQPRDTYSDRVRPLIRSVAMYDQLTTRGMFDALWLCDGVRTAYADLHIFRQGYGDERRNAFLTRQLEENNHYISFYVLAQSDAKLSAPDSQWAIFLEVDGNRYQPIDNKMVELPYEYQVFFGKAWSRFKDPYQIRFGLRDVQDLPIITAQTKKIALHIRSAGKEHALTWDIPSVACEEVTPRDDTQYKEPVKKERVPRKKRSGKRGNS